MKNFTFHTPTEIIFGKGAQSETCSLIKKYGGTRVLLVYGGGSVVRNGILPEIENNLKAANIPYKLHGGVRPNPVASHVRDGVKSALGFKADFILALGGGSAIDEAKAIAHGAANPENDFWDFWLAPASLTATLPFGVILTISAAGSETSMSAVITNEQTGQKKGLTTPLNRPKFAIMNPEFTYTLPEFQIACGVADIMMHTLERYFTPETGNALTDEIAEGLLRVVVKCGRKALENPSDYDAMSEIMWCGSLSHNGLTGLGRPMDFSVHQLAHELGAMFDATHGAALTTMWGWWAKTVYQTDIARFARSARNVWGVPDTSDDSAAVAGIERTVNYFKELGLPTNFTELGIGVLPDETILDLAARCSWQGKRSIGQFHPLAQENIAKVYGLANR